MAVRGVVAYPSSRIGTEGLCPWLKSVFAQACLRFALSPGGVKAWKPRILQLAAGSLNNGKCVSKSTDESASKVYAK